MMTRSDHATSLRLSDAAGVLTLAARIRQRRSSSLTVSERCLARIHRNDPSLHAFVTVAPEHARGQAHRADDDLKRGIVLSSLHGVPYAVKDNFSTAGIPTTCNSRLLKDHVPSKNAAVVARLQAAGCVLAGKLSMDEFGLGGNGPDNLSPPVRNPWNGDHSPGGSSSGCAAAVAAGLVPFAIGSDTGGSTRVPAAFCGVVGVKPTRGVLDRDGMHALAPTLDHCGLFTRSVADAAIVLAVLCGREPDVPEVEAGRNESANGLRIGLLLPFFDDAGPANEQVEAIGRVKQLLAAAGAELTLIDRDLCPEHTMFRACGATIMLAEAYRVHERTLKRFPRAYSRATLKRLCLGATIEATEVGNAMRLRERLTERMLMLSERFDVLMCPTVLTTAPVNLSSMSPMFRATPARAMAFNVTGLPAMTVPIGVSQRGLPLALQLVARPFNEPMLFRAGLAVEGVLGSDSDGYSQRANKPEPGNGGAYV